MRIKNHDDSNLYIVQGEVVVSRPSVVTVSSFGRQKLIDNMTRVSVCVQTSHRQLPQRVLLQLGFPPTTVI